MLFYFESWVRRSAMAAANEMLFYLYIVKTAPKYESQGTQTKSINNQNKNGGHGLMVVVYRKQTLIVPMNRHIGGLGTLTL